MNVSLKTMRLYPEKYAWRIAAVGFNRKGEPYYVLFSVKEALEFNPKREWSRTV